MAMKKINIDVVREIALSLPDVKESTLHGVPSFKLRGKLLTCPAIHHSAEPGTLAVRFDFDERERLIAAEPGIYYVTEHYVAHPMVLMRMSHMTRTALKDLLGMACQFIRSPTKATESKRMKQGGGKAK